MVWRACRELNASSSLESAGASCGGAGAGGGAGVRVELRELLAIAAAAADAEEVTAGKEADARDELVWDSYRGEVD